MTIRDLTLGGDRADARPPSLRITCPHCFGDAVTDEPRAPTRAPVTYDRIESLCACGDGTLLVRLNWSDERRLFNGEDGRYVHTDYPPFTLDGRLYVHDGAGETVEVEDADVECSLCDEVLPETARTPLCTRCEQTSRACGRLMADADKYPDPEHAR